MSKKSVAAPTDESTTVEAPLVVRFKKNHPDAELPEYATEGAACFDLRVMVPQGEVLLDRHRPQILDTGLKPEVPEGHVMLVFSRSGHGFKHDVSLSNCVGVIDADYRGPLMVKLRSDGPTPLVIRHKDRAAQAMVVPVDRVRFEMVEELTDTERGEGGLGSTGNV